MYRIVHDSPDIAAVPTELRALVHAALARNSNERPAAADLLRQLMGRTDVAATGMAARTRTMLARDWLIPAAPATDFLSGAVRRTRLRHPLVLAGVALAVAIAAGASAGLVATSPGQPQLTASPTITSSPGTQAVKAASATAPASDPSSVSQSTSAARVTSSCTTGMLDSNDGEFYSMSDIASGEGLTSGDATAEAYQLTLTDSQSARAVEVTGFAVAFYSDGQELTSESETLDEPMFITPGQSLTWTEHPWGYSSGGASVGPYAAGQTGAVDPGATCELIQYSS